MKTPVLILSSFLSVALLGADDAWYRDEGGVNYPTAGVINRECGTVEVRLRPSADLDSNIPGWPFAFSVIGGDEQTRTLLALFHQPNDAFEKPRIRMTGLARTSNGGVYAIENAPAPKAGESVVYALSWQSGGDVTLFRNGRRIARSKMRAPLRRLPTFFSVHDVAPLRADRIRVSTRALADAELSADPERPFAAGPDTSLVANDLERPVFALTPAFRDAEPFADPFAPMSARILRAGEPLVLPFAACNPADAVDVPVALTVHALHTGAERQPGGTLRRTLKPAPRSVGATVTVDFGRLPAGYYAAETCGRPFRVLVLPKDAAGDGALADYLGLAHVRKVDAFAKTGVRWTRLWNQSELLWHMVEPQPGRFEFATADRVVDAYRRAGIRILATLGYPPEWASRKPQPAPGEKHSFAATPDRWQPRSTDEWRTYVRETGRHFADRVDAWEIWNEVDWHPPAKAASFSGTTEDYFALLQGASAELRAAAPKARILVSGFGCIPITDGDRMRRDLIGMGAAKCVDAWNMHAYGALAKGAECRDEIRAVAPAMPIWQSEFMWHVISDPFRQAYLTALIHCQYLEFGYAKFFDFGWGEYLTDFHTESPLEPLAALAVQQEQFRCCEKLEGRISSLPKETFDLDFSFRRTDGKHLALVGSSSGDYTVRPANEVRAACDLFGRRAKAEADGSFALHGSALYLVTDKPLEVARFTCLKPAQLIANGGVEDLQGDTLDGLDKCTPLAWQIRTQRDPKGRIVPTADGAIAGKHSLKIEAPSDKGDVYAFVPVKLPAAGKFRLTATVKGLSGAPKPYLAQFDQTPPYKMQRRAFDTLKPDETRTLTFDATFEAPPAGTVAAIVGIRGPGGVLVDEVSLVPVSSSPAD